MNIPKPVVLNGAKFTNSEPPKNAGNTVFSVLFSCGGGMVGSFGSLELLVTPSLGQGVLFTPLSCLPLERGSFFFQQEVLVNMTAAQKQSFRQELLHSSSREGSCLHNQQMVSQCFGAALAYIHPLQHHGLVLHKHLAENLSCNFQIYHLDLKVNSLAQSQLGL